jgi:hypothetical protein
LRATTPPASARASANREPRVAARAAYPPGDFRFRLSLSLSLAAGVALLLDLEMSVGIGGDLGQVRDAQYLERRAEHA